MPIECVYSTPRTEASLKAASVSKEVLKGSSHRSKVLRAIFANGAPSFKKQKLQIAATLAGVVLEISDASEDELTALMPSARTCVLMTGDGPLTQSGAALRYIGSVKAGTGLYGDTPYDESLIDSWLEVSVYEIEVAVVLMQDNKSALKAVRGDVERALTALNEWLSSRTFLVTETPTIADIAMVCVIQAAFDVDLLPVDLGDAVKGPKAFLTNVARWFLTCAVRFQTSHALIAKLKDLMVQRKSVAPGPKTETTTTKELGAVEDELEKNPEALFSATYKRSRTRVKELLRQGKAALDKTVTVKGWVRSVREAMKGTTAFVELNDGSSVLSLQVVASKETTANFEGLKLSGGTGSALSFQGLVVESMGKGQTIEVQATSVDVLGPTRGGPNRQPGSATYPLAKKFHTPEHLRLNAHLRPRSRLGSAMVRCRHALAFATHEFFQKRGFLYVHTPLITGADCEGAGEQFTVTTLLPDDDENPGGAFQRIPTLPNGAVDFSKDFFGKRCGLTVSGQLNVETHAVALSDCYTFGPTFRAENSHTARHLAEFWMIEPELSFGDLSDDIDLATDYLKYCVAAVLTRCEDDLKFFEQAHEKGLRDRLHEILEKPFPRLDYTEAITILQKAIKEKTIVFEVNDVYWGMDLNSEHEKYLTDVVSKGPLVLINYPKDIKAFYMKLNPDNKTVAAMDILVPKIGEIIGGSQREDDLDTLEARCAEVGLDPAGIKWYTDLRLYGSVPHAGFGLGFERLVMLVTGIDNIRDAIPFPRYPGHADF